MQPVTIKSNQSRPTLFLLQVFLVLLMAAGLILTLLVHWSYLAMFLPAILVWHRNQGTMRAQINWSWVMSGNHQWNLIDADEVRPVVLIAHWHFFGHLFLAWQDGDLNHHCWVTRASIGGAQFARLLVGVNQSDTEHE